MCVYVYVYALEDVYVCVGLRTSVYVSVYVREVCLCLGRCRYGVSAYLERESLREVYVLYVNMSLCGTVYLGYLGMRA